MDALVTRYTVDISKPLQPVMLQPMLVCQDQLANRIVVDLVNGDSPVSITGTVSGKALRADGNTVALVNGSSSGGSMSIDLPEAAYAVEGRVIISLSVATAQNKVTLFVGVGSVIKTESGSYVDPGEVINDIDDLIADINAAVASIPADYSALLATIAPNYADLTFPVSAGQWCWYSGVLYAANQDISTSENWTAAHWRTVTVGGEVASLKSALTPIQNVLSDDIIQYATEMQSGYYDNGGSFHASSNWVSYLIPTSVLRYILTVSSYAATSLTTCQVAFFSGSPSSSTFISGVKFTTASALNTVSDITVPSSAMVAVLSNRASSGDMSATGIVDVDVIDTVRGLKSVKKQIVSDQLIGSISGDVGSTISIGTQTYWTHICEDVTAGEIYNVKFYTSSASNSNAYVIVTDDDDVIIAKYADNIPTTSSVEKTYDITIPSSATKIYVRSYNHDVAIAIYTDAATAIETTSNTVVDIASEVEDIKTAINNGSMLNELYFRSGVKQKNRMLFSAHRGAEGQAPYGSYPCYELACQQGWDMIQIAQARQSADGTWYCIHNEAVDDQTNGTGNIDELTDAYIDTIYQDVGENIGSYTHEQMKLPTLESVLKLAYQYGVMVSIRMGSLPNNATGSNAAPWASFISLCKKYNPGKMMFSGTRYQVDTLKSLTDNWHGQEYITTNTVETELQSLVSAGYTNISILADRSLVSASLIAQIHDAGYYYVSSQITGVTPTVDDYKQLSDWGCDIAQTGLSSIHSLQT